MGMQMYSNHPGSKPASPNVISIDICIVSGLLRPIFTPFHLVNSFRNHAQSLKRLLSYKHETQLWYSPRPRQVLVRMSRQNIESSSPMLSHKDTKSRY